MSSSSTTPPRISQGSGDGIAKNKPIRIKMFEDPKPSPSSTEASGDKISAKKSKKCLTNAEICETLSKLRTYLKSSETEKTPEKYASASAPTPTIIQSTADYSPTDTGDTITIISGKFQEIPSSHLGSSFRPPWIFGDENANIQHVRSAPGSKQSSFASSRSSNRNYICKVEHRKPNKAQENKLENKTSAVDRFRKFLQQTKKPVNRGVKVSVKPVIDPSVLQEIQAMYDNNRQPQGHQDQK